MLTHRQIAQLTALGTGNDEHYMHKFTRNPAKWWWRACKIATGLGLHEQPPQRILDIGCGFPYFAHVCGELGHDVVGHDVPDTMIEQAASILGQDVWLHTLQAREKLQRAGGDKDLITVFGVNFRYGDPARSKDYWVEDDYAFLIADLRTRLLPGGSIVVRPNRPEPRPWWQRVAGLDASVSIDAGSVEIQWRD